MKKLEKVIERIKRDIRQFWAAGVAFIVYYLIVKAIFDAFCPFLIITGFPCAGCGLTRAGLHLLRGNIRQAAGMNPSIFLVVFFLLYCGYFRYLKGTKVKHFSLVLGVFAGIMLAVYAYRMYLYFPDKVPYVYHKKNLLAEILPWYERLVSRIFVWIRT